MSNGGALTQDIITDILYRLPVKSLCRFKCVSPSWNSLISSPHFAKTHLNRIEAKNPKLFDHNIILISSDHILYSVNLTADVPIATKLDLPSLQPSENKWVLCSCNGLLLLSDPGNSKFFLLNPSTRECKKLSTLPYSVLDLVDGSDLYAFGVGYDSSRDDYKIVMVSKDNIESYAQSDTRIVAVYSLKTDDWRRIQDIHYIPVTNTRVFLNGCLHCICQRDGYTVVVAFDLSDEIFREVPLPASFRSYELFFYKLAVVAGCLCLVDFGTYRIDRIDVWMMKEYGVRESWTKFTIDPGMSPVHLLCLLAEDKFLLRTNVHRQEKLVLYNSKKETLRDMVVCGIPHLYTFWGTYVESLISPHHGGGIGRQ